MSLREREKWDDKQPALCVSLCECYCTPVKYSAESIYASQRTVGLLYARCGKYFRETFLS